jgi:hypothetical protein
MAWDLAIDVPAVYDVVCGFERTAYPALQMHLLEMLFRQRYLEEDTLTWNFSYLKMPKLSFNPSEVYAYTTDDIIEVAYSRAELPADIVPEDAPESERSSKLLAGGLLAVSFERLGISAPMMNTLLQLLRGGELEHERLAKKDLDHLLFFIQLLGGHVRELVCAVQDLHAIARPVEGRAAEVRKEIKMLYAIEAAKKHLAALKA